MQKKGLLALILGLSFLLKVPALGNALIGHFASYQAVNAMMAVRLEENFLWGFLRPEIFILRGQEAGLHLLYAPLASLAAALPHTVFGGSLEFWGRFQAALWMLGAAWILYRIVRTHFSENLALLAAVLFSFSPLVLTSGMSFQNEAAAVFLFLAACRGMLSNKTGGILAAGLLFGIAVAARLHFLILGPVFLFLAADLRDHQRVRACLVFILGAAFPVAGWYGLMTYWHAAYPDQVFTSFSGQMGEGRILTASLLTDPAFYKRLFHIYAELWLTPILFPFVLASLFFFRKKKLRPFLVMILGCWLMTLLIPKKVWDHPFYVLAGVPGACVAAGYLLLEIPKRFPKKIFIGILIVFFGFSLRYFLPPARTFPQSERDIVKIGTAVKAATGPEDLVVAQHASNSLLLYYTGRLGWGFDMRMESMDHGTQERTLKLLDKGYGNLIAWLEYLRSQGADYFVAGQPESFTAQAKFADYLTRRYQEIPFSVKQARLFDLNREIG